MITLPDLPKIDFIYLSEPDMIRAGVTDMAKCIATMEEAFPLLYRGDYRMAGGNNDSHGAMVTFPPESPFPNMPKPTAERRFMAMPAYLGGSFQTTGVKWYGSNIENRTRGLPRSILMYTLNDTDTCAPLAHMSANLLSAYRTGAVPGMGAKYLARKDSRVIGVLGPGVMARTVVTGFMSACPHIDTIKVKGRGKTNLEGFIAWAKDSFPQLKAINVVETDEEVVRGSDIVTYCLSGVVGDAAKYATVRREWVKPGAFLAMPAQCNTDEGMERHDVRKVLDCPGMYEAWCEEMPKPAHNHVAIIGVKYWEMMLEGRMERGQLEDIGQIVAGEAPGRKNEDEIILMSLGGLPIADVAWATVLYRNAVKEGIGVKLNIWQQPALS